MITRKRLNIVSIFVAIFCCILFATGFLSGCGETNSDVINPPNEQEEQTEQIKVEITKDNISNYIIFNIFNELVGTRPYTYPNGTKCTIYTYHTTITVRSKNTNYEFENIEIEFGPKIAVPYKYFDVYLTVELDNKGNGYYEASFEMNSSNFIYCPSSFKSASDALPKIIRSVNDGVDNKGYVYIKQN